MPVSEKFRALHMQLKEDGFIERPYGWKKTISENKMQIVIAPGYHTAVGSNDAKLFKAYIPIEGKVEYTKKQVDVPLRPHPGIAKERATHLGYLDTYVVNHMHVLSDAAEIAGTVWSFVFGIPLGGPNLNHEETVYVYLDEEGEVKRRYYQPGDSLLSLGGNKGYWHTIYHGGGKAAKILIEQEFQK
jgi:hypothetical protein